MAARPDRSSLRALTDDAADHTGAFTTDTADPAAVSDDLRAGAREAQADDAWDTAPRPGRRWWRWTWWRRRRWWRWRWRRRWRWGGTAEEEEEEEEEAAAVVEVAAVVEEEAAEAEAAPVRRPCDRRPVARRRTEARTQPAGTARELGPRGRPWTQGRTRHPASLRSEAHRDRVGFRRGQHARRGCPRSRGASPPRQRGSSARSRERSDLATTKGRRSESRSGRAPSRPLPLWRPRRCRRSRSRRRSTSRTRTRWPASSRRARCWRSESRLGRGRSRTARPGSRRSCRSSRASQTR